MAPDLTVVVNSCSGRLGREKKTALVKNGLKAAGLSDYVLHTTDYPNHGRELARQAVQQGHTTIVAAGGDGTINEVLNGILSLEPEPEAVSLGIVPLGTANDLANLLELPRDVTKACRQIAAGQTRLLDVGQVNGHYFINNSAVGLEPVVTMTQHRMRWLKSTLRYVVAALKVVLSASTWEMQLDWGRGMYEGPIVLVSVGNGPRTGGAFLMTPQAKPDDGQFDFVYGIGMNRFQMLYLLPKIFRGRHLGSPLVGYNRTQTLSITCRPGTPIQADGEVIAEDATRIEYKLLPARLRVIV